MHMHVCECTCVCASVAHECIVYPCTNIQRRILGFPSTTLCLYSLESGTLSKSEVRLEAIKLQ